MEIPSIWTESRRFIKKWFGKFIYAFDLYEEIWCIKLCKLWFASENTGCMFIEKMINKFLFVIQWTVGASAMLPFLLFYSINVHVSQTESNLYHGIKQNVQEKCCFEPFLETSPSFYDCFYIYFAVFVRILRKTFNSGFAINVRNHGVLIFSFPVQNKWSKVDSGAVIENVF